MSTKPNLKDVAKVAGVSAITVSRVLTDPSRVSEKLRSKVEKAIHDIGYIRNHAASALASKKSGVLAVIIPSLSNIVFNDVLQGIYQAVKAKNLQVLLGDCHYSPLEEEKLIATLLSQSPEGIIVTGAAQTDYARKLLLQADIPVIQIMELTHQPIDMNIGFSHYQASYDMTNHLLQRGYRAPAFLGARMDPRTQQRLAGFKQAITDWPQPCSSYIHTTVQPSSIKLGGQLLQAVIAESNHQCDAVFCCNDDLALGALFESKRMNLSVPKDIAICGFNDLEASALVEPAITSVSSPRSEMGRQAVEMLFSATGKGRHALAPVDVGYNIIVRSST
ncbi:LacI family DNA-binding transcriptional regulator [Rheinheimera baltica]|uniref:LacI family DNA-binding transcriptional regulator n=1 Tax=Rheinheimera baltica TaxID=67576 RepID=A0ABT9HTW3_9GAMM|nr:LacI family DNA-binding transcriptional regulator [Rheinheimera baltica]MDP5134448.1 LacI family DNA-binding transcriptional regulator [Rheinheimera baltica]MDP5148503.1 LacI family DNA-binding transcriptional regulator [Rheinheimera baltica]